MSESPPKLSASMGAVGSCPIRAALPPVAEPLHRQQLDHQLDLQRDAARGRNNSLASAPGVADPSAISEFWA
jgi:hypothetical protein